MKFYVGCESGAGTVTIEASSIRKGEPGRGERLSNCKRGNKREERGGRRRRMGRRGRGRAEEERGGKGRK